MEISDGHFFRLDHLRKAESVLAARAGRGEKVFTGAYVVPGVPGQSKPHSVCQLVTAVAAAAPQVMSATMRGTWAALTLFDGLGSFLAGQVVADIAHLPCGRSWSDSGNWAPVGPGSARGINRLLGRPKDKSVTQLEFEHLLAVLI